MILVALMLIGVGAVVLGMPARSRLRPTGTVPAWRRTATATRRYAVSRWRRRARQDARRRAAAEFVLALAAELGTGAPLATALRRAGEGHGFLSQSLGAVRVGGDVPAALRADGRDGDLLVLTGLAAVWQVSAESGAGLADAAYRLGAAALQRERMRRELAAQMAAPRATAMVLAVLPVVGLVLGSGLGGAPVSWLLGSPIGLMVLALGAVLELAGLMWVRHMVRRVEQHL